MKGSFVELIRRKPGKRARPERGRQRLLPFFERAARRDRRFKGAIVGATVLAIAAVIGLNPDNRLAVWRLAVWGRSATLRAIGGKVGRTETEALTHARRLRDIERVRAALGRAARESGPKVAEFLRVARMDPESACIRWGNYTGTLVLSSAVFEPDERRSYRLRPRTRSIWLLRLMLSGTLAMFEVLDTPEARAAGVAAGGYLVPESVQTTNSWGCRGPEPDPKARWRGIVLGDSFMQGLLLGDDQTPPVYLERALNDRLGGGVSILNTGHLGYSLEQYDATLRAFGDRFRPRFAVISVCANDFGDLRLPAERAEASYWIERIAQYCRSRTMLYLIVPVPGEDGMLSIRSEGIYPGLVSDIFRHGGAHYVNPMEAFTDEHLRLAIAGQRRGSWPLNSPLYNGDLGDHHFSALGARVWAEVVARRLAYLLESRELLFRDSKNAPASRPAGR